MSANAAARAGARARLRAAVLALVSCAALPGAVLPGAVLVGGALPGAAAAEAPRPGAGLRGEAPGRGAAANDAARLRRWTAVFDPREGPRQLWFRATFTDAQGLHELQVWRDGTARLRRRTDGRLDLYVARQAKGALAFQVVDVQRKVRVGLDEASVARLGSATDWSALSGRPAMPGQDFSLAAEPRPPQALPAGSCRWYVLEVASSPPSRSRICWARRLGLPLAIRRVEGGGAERAVFEVKEASVLPLDPGLLAPPPDLTALQPPGRAIDDGARAP